MARQSFTFAADRITTHTMELITKIRPAAAKVIMLKLNHTTDFIVEVTHYATLGLTTVWTWDNDLPTTEKRINHPTNNHLN